MEAENSEVSEQLRGRVLRAIDKLDRLGAAGVRDLLGPGRKDESGDYTHGAGLDNGQIDQIMEFVVPEADGDNGADHGPPEPPRFGRR